MLMFFGLPLSSPLIVFEFAVIHYPAYGRVGVTSNFNEIETVFVGPFNGLCYRHDTYLLALNIN